MKTQNQTTVPAAKTTPLPWTLAKVNETENQIVQFETGTMIADCDQLNGLSLGESKANAELIIRAVNEHAALDEYQQVCEKFVAFLGSLPKGWLGKTTGDIGLLNDAYIQEARAKTKLDAIRNQNLPVQS